MSQSTAVDDLQHLLRSAGPIFLDGGFATELEARGFKLNTPLWSARMLLEHAAEVEKVHSAFLYAGANIVETGTYQLSREGCEHEGVADWKTLALRGAACALSAVRELPVSVRVPGPHVVAGSIGPLGAAFHDGSEYTGAYGLAPAGEATPVLPITRELRPGRQSSESIRDFHAPRARALLDAGVGLLAFETVPCVLEVAAIAGMLRDEFPSARAWISLSCKSASELVSGEPIVSALAAIDAADPAARQVVAVGANCVHPSIVEGIIATMTSHTQPPGPADTATASPTAGRPSAPRRRILVYPNRGEVWNAASNQWEARSADDPLCVAGADSTPSEEEFLRLAVRWRKGGAWGIGGCCRCSPELMAAVRRRVLEAEGAATGLSLP
jgi:homocysteine S-methyltransferase